MKLLCFLVACCCFAQAQAQLLLSGKIKNAVPGTPLVVNIPYDAWYHKANSVEVWPDAQGQFKVNLPVAKPQTVFLDYGGKRIYLYAEATASLALELDASLFPEGITFRGSLKKENKFRQELGLTSYKLGPQTWNDTTTSPAQILTSIEQNQKVALAKVKASARSFSAPFRQMLTADVQYFAAAKMWRLLYTHSVFSGKNKSAYGPQEWRQALKAAHTLHPISNPEAVSSYFYQEVLAYFPRFLELSAASKAEFASTVEAIFQKPFPEARKEIKEKGERYWEHKAILHGLQGAALESALASFINTGIEEGDISYQQEAYDDFLQRFPQSKYLPHLKEQMKRFWQSQDKSSAGQTELVLNADQMKTLADILPAHKGRVVYLDLWGSWCGPCREEFGYVKALKERFQYQPVDFLYIAFERSTNPTKNWQETIKFYNLAGKHILGSKELEQYFQALYAQQGSMEFPSYLLIDKNGKIVSTRAARPSSKGTLYRQIEELL